MDKELNEVNCSQRTTNIILSLSNTFLIDSEEFRDFFHRSGYAVLQIYSQRKCLYSKMLNITYNKERQAMQDHFIYEINKEWSTDESVEK